MQSSKVAPNQEVEDPLSADRRRLTREMTTLSGSEILGRILGHENPQKIVQDMPSQDFFWLVKKVGEEDCLPLLELASTDQWLYLLDLEIWRKDRLDLDHTSIWLRRLQEAQPKRLVRWLFGQGQNLAYYYLFKSIKLIIKEKNEDLQLPIGFFSLDGVFYIRVIDPRYRDTIEGMLREMAHEDSLRYQALLLGLAGLIPAETEEEMYRIRNIRLAEHGFLPSEEAISVYAPLDVKAFERAKEKELRGISLDAESRAVVPLSPLYHTGTGNILTTAISEIVDPVFLDRLRLEFAGLCNQILSADGVLAHELEALIKTCRKAAGYLNLALEKLCGNDTSLALRCLKSYSLLSIFRAGFGLALKVKWEAERWIKESWFSGLGLDSDFWGENWGGMLSGLLEKRPHFYIEPHQGGEEFRGFEGLSELGDCLKALHCLMVLDALLERIAGQYPVDKDLVHSTELTFHPLLFNFWARSLLKLEPSFSGISLSQARKLFRQLRSGTKRRPYRMHGFEETFVRYFISYASSSDTEAASILREALSLIWQEFREEYEWVPTRDLNKRYSRFISIISNPGPPHQ